MKKKITILGSTGSIGKTLLNIIKKNLTDYLDLFFYFFHFILFINSGLILMDIGFYYL